MAKPNRKPERMGGPQGGQEWVERESEASKEEQV
jgi:hypothetical protein